MYCVIDTERIKGSYIYLFSYQLYSDDFALVKSKTYQNISIDLSNRKSPKSKVQKLSAKTIKVTSFQEIFDVYKSVIANNTLIVFNKTDLGAIRQNCKELALQFEKTTTYDMQQVLLHLSTSAKKKSNLKDYCKANGIKHDSHIPESDCEATFAVFKNMIQLYGFDFLDKFKV